MATARRDPYYLVTAPLINEAPTARQDEGVFIDLPFLESPRYNWFSLMSIEMGDYDARAATIVSRDHLPEQGVVLPVHVRERMAFIPLADTDENYKITQKELELHRRGINNTISGWLKHFIVWCACQVGVAYPDRPIRNWADFMDWIERFQKTPEDAMMIMKAFIFSFDYTVDYRRQIATACLMQKGLAFLPSDRPGSNPKNFLEKIVTHRHNLIRKQINDASLLRTGYKYLIIRPHRSVGEPALPPAQEKIFYEWQLQYTPIKKSKKRKDIGTDSTKFKRKSRRNCSTYSDNNEKRSKLDVLADIEELDRERSELVLELQQFATELNKEEPNTETIRANITPTCSIPLELTSTPRISKVAKKHARTNDILTMGQYSEDSESDDEVLANLRKQIYQQEKNDLVMETESDSNTIIVVTSNKVKESITKKKLKNNGSQNTKINATKNKKRKSMLVVTSEKQANTSKGKVSCTQTLTQMYSPSGRRKNVKKGCTVEKKKENKDDTLCCKEILETSIEVNDDEYDIPCSMNVPHIEISKESMDDNNDDVKPIKILNVRKGKGWKLEMMVLYCNGVTEWIFLHGILEEMEQETLAFMATCGLNFSICGYSKDTRGFTKKQRDNIRLYCDYEPPLSTKLKPIAANKREIVDFNLLTKIIHIILEKDNKSLNYTILSKVIHPIELSL